MMSEISKTEAMEYAGLDEPHSVSGSRQERLVTHDGYPMDTAPRDGTEIEILFRHMNYKYAASDDKCNWQQWCVARWTDFNGGGWVWHGIAGVPIGWRHAG